MPSGFRPARSLMTQTDVIRKGGTFNSGPGRQTRGPKPPRGVPKYTFPVASRKIDSNSTAVNVFNTTSETTVVTVEAPALTIRNQGATRLTAVGTFDNDSGGAIAATMRIKASDGTPTTVLATSGISCSASANTRRWSLETIMYGEATNAQSHWGTVDFGVASTSTVAPSTYAATGYGTSALDDLEPITVTVTVQLDTASTDATFIMESAILEAVTG